MKIKVLTVVMALSISIIPPLLSREQMPFKEKLLYFQYSMLKELHHFDLYQLRSYPFIMKSAQRLNEQCEKFYTANTDNIKKYRIEELEKYRNIKIDLQKVALKDSALSEKKDCDILVGLAEKYNKSGKDTLDYFKNSYLFKVMLISPLYHINMAIGFYSSVTDKSGNGMDQATMSMRLSIGRALVRTESKDGKTWKIIIDRYSDVFVFRYSVDTGKLCLLQTGTRKIPERKSTGNENTPDKP